MLKESSSKNNKTEELLKSMGLVDATPRPMGKRDKVEIFCSVCKSEVILVQFYNALNKFKTKGYSAKCKKCLSVENSDRGKKRTGNKNSFYGKKHTTEAISRIKETREVASEKGKETSLARYGTERPAQSDEIKQKTAETCLIKFGAASFLGSERGKQKKKEGLMSKHGVTNPCFITESNIKKKQTILDRYGVDHFSKTEEFKKALSARRKDSKRIVLSDGSFVVDLCRDKQVNLSNSLRVLKAYGEAAFLSYISGDRSGINSLEALVLSWGINGVSRFNKMLPDLPYRPDFICDNGVYINADGIYWHSDAHKDSDYHNKMRQAMEASGLRILQFREDEIRFKPMIVQSIIKNATGQNDEKLDARKCKIVDVTVSQYKDFFVESHLMGNRHATGAAGLLFNGSIVACMSYMQSGQTLEISRFANKLFTSVRGGFSRLLSHIEKQRNPSIVQSFCDLRYATGGSYTRNGFSLQSVTQGWNWTDGRFVFNRLTCRANMDERKLSEAEHAKEMGIYKIYDAGQAKYVKMLRIVRAPETIIRTLQVGAGALRPFSKNARP